LRLLTRAALLAIAPALFAQSERGNITGTVTDPTGAGVPTAQIVLVHRDTNATAKATATTSGEFNFTSLTPGVYRLQVTASGFKQFVRQNIVLSASATVRADAQLQLGQVSEQVEVTAAASMVQTDDAKVTTQVDNKLVDELPLQVAGDMRSPFNLVDVVPEARGSGQALSLGAGQVARGTPRSTATAWGPTAPATPRRPRSTRPRSTRSPSSPWTPTALRRNTRRPAAA
jgi:hypothetical protein